MFKGKKKKPVVNPDVVEHRDRDPNDPRVAREALAKQRAELPVLPKD